MAYHKAGLGIVTSCALILFGSSIAAYGQTTIYSDDFSAASGALHGTTPDATIGTNTWSANNPFNANGTIANPNTAGSAILPFNPVPNASYTLTVDFNNSVAQWIGLGFARDPLLSPNGSNANDRFSNEPEGISWLLYRNSATANQDVQIFDGLRTAGGSYAADPVTDFSVTHNFKIILNTTGEGLSFTADYLLDNVSLLPGGPRTINRNIDDINFVGLSYTNAATTPAPTFDNFVLTSQGTVNEWNVDGGGSFNTPGNWTMGLPPSGGTVQFGTVLTAPNAPATVTLNTAISLGQVFFANSASYNLAGPGALTLTGPAKVVVTAGTHEISAVVDGSAGLTKSGGGVLVLSNNNSYTGDTTISAGTLAIPSFGAINQASGATTISTGATLQLRGDSMGGGVNGTLSEALSGGGQLRLDPSLTTETITIASANAGFTGTVSVGGGTLSVSDGGALGSADGLAATGTVVGGNLETGTLRLIGVSVTGERLELVGRQPTNFDPHMISTGTSSWTGPIAGNTGGNQYAVESQSGTLTLSGNITMPDTANDTNGRNLDLTGSGNGVVSGKIIDRTAATGDGAENVNINVVKKGTGTWTIATGTTTRDDFHQGRTIIEQGTLAVQAAGGTDGELYSRTIEVASGATFDVSSFSSYSLQAVENPDNVFSTGDEVGQELKGTGTIIGNIAAFDDSIISPGSSVGQLNINGNFSYSSFTPLATGRWNYELGNTTAAGDSDRLAVSGSVTVDSTSGGVINLDVSPVEGTLASGAYTLVQASSVGGTATNSEYVIKLRDAAGNDITAGARQTFSITNAATTISVNVTGSSANLSWAGTAGNSWDVETTANFTMPAATTFSHLDSVTFGNVANKNVTVNTNVAPGSVAFSGGVGSTYTVTGTGGMTGFGAVSVNSGTVKLNNTGNAYAGTTTVASGARLEMASASTGNMVVNGTLSVSGNVASTLVDNFNDGNISEYTTYTVLDQIGSMTTVGPPDDIVYSSAGTAITVNGAQAGNPAPEQALALRLASLAVGETLVVDANLNSDHSTFTTVGIAIADSTVQADVPSGMANADIRKGYLITGMRLGEPNDGQNSQHVQVAGGTVSSTGPGNIGEVTNLWITRTGADSYTTGHSKDNMATRVPADSRTGIDWTPDSVGFYADVRGALTPNAGTMDNLRIAPGSNHLLEVNGDLTLASSGTIELEIGQDVYDQIAVTGIASLAGGIEVDLAGVFDLVDGARYTLLTATGGILDMGFDLTLPENFSAEIENMNSLVLTYSATLDGDFNLDGTVDAADYVMWRKQTGPGADYDDWVRNFGSSQGSGGGVDSGGGNVPEPAAWMIVAVALAIVLASYRRPSVGYASCGVL